MVIVGLDPSITSTGYALIDSDDKHIIKCGRIRTSPKNSTNERIMFIIKELEFIYSIYLANICEIQSVMFEDGFIGPNKKGSLDLAELRGALMAYHSYKHLEVYRKQPTAIRKQFGLPGNAKKDEVAKKVSKLYPNLEEEIGPYSDKNNKYKTSDVYDAISIALAGLESDDKREES